MSEKISKNNGQQEQRSDSEKTKKHFAEPRLTFVEPKLTHQGNVNEITGSFINYFVPE